MFHKFLILTAAINIVAIFVRYFLFDGEINGWAVIVCGLVITGELRELYVDRIKEQYAHTLVTLTSLRESVFSICDAETIDRISMKAADNIVEMAPEEFKPELQKVNELLKKMHKSQQGG